MKNSVFGIALLAWLILTRGSYRGMRAFYRLAQESHPWAAGLLSGPLAGLCTDFEFSKQATRARLSDRAIAEYSDDTLSGYGEESYGKGGETLETQQRGLILPLLRTLHGTVVEIGTGNGDVIAHLAAEHPDVRFIGIDFSIYTAERKHHLPNLRFLAGYALDVFPACDIVFMSSTACVFTPAELGGYLVRFRSSGVKEIVFNEPTWAGYTIDEGEPRSAHLERAVWYHNYPAYLKANGYGVKTMRLDPYRHLRSTRPDIRVALVKGVA